jgi:hypothetical protein
MDRPLHRRRWVRLALIAAALGALAVTGGRLTGGQITRDRGGQAQRPSPSQISAASTDATASPSPTAGPQTADAGGPGDAGPITVRYRFDAGLPSTVLDDAGMVPLHVATASSGVLRTEPRGDGLAVRFPAPCPVYGDPSCSRAILQSGPADVLNPGNRPLRFGASVRLVRSEVTAGGNVLQKGYSVGDSQYKLQIDGAGGRPSCVLVGVASSRIDVVTASVSVADGQWHAVECARSGTALTIVVDGIVRGQINVPAHLSIVNSDPLRIGGKGTGPNNDQFNGAIDDAFVVIGT